MSVTIVTIHEVRDHGCHNLKAVMCVFHTWLQKSSDPGRQVLQGTALAQRRTMMLTMMLISEDDERC